MNILFISTYNTQCGIATYTEYLAKTLKSLGHQITIFAEDPRNKLNPYMEPDTEFPVYRIWKRSAPFDASFGLKGIIKTIESANIKPDVIHIQHEFGLFPDNKDFETFVYLLSLLTKVIVTLHTVTRPPRNIGFFSRSLYAKTIVHTAEAALFASCDKFGDSSIIPHGVKEAKDAELYIDRINCLIPGFISPSKGHLEIIDAFADAFDDEARLNIIGLCRHPQYLLEIKNKIRSYSLEQNIIINEGFKSDEEMDIFLRQANCVILGGDRDSPYSASGQLAQAIGYKLPIIAKNTPIYRSQYSPLILRYKKSEELSKILGQFIKDPDLLKNFSNHTNYMTWDEVAKEHEKVYRT